MHTASVTSNSGSLRSPYNSFILSNGDVAPPTYPTSIYPTTSPTGDDGGGSVVGATTSTNDACSIPSIITHSI